VTPYEIPLSPEPQQFTIELGGQSRRLRLYWCRDAQCWCLDIRDPGGEPLVLGLPVVTGCDILGQHKHLGLGGSLIAQTDNEADAVPTFDNLGTLGRLYFVVED